MNKTGIPPPPPNPSQNKVFVKDKTKRNFIKKYRIKH
jgi:hypothetical protein